MDTKYYKAVIAQLNKVYGTKSDVEHEFIHEFFEGPIPLFKLILSETDDGRAGAMIASFHIELDSVDAIQWFLRVRELDPELQITGCYLKDEDGVSYVGEDAAILRMHMIEQDLATAWAHSIAQEAGPDDQPPVPLKLSPLRAFNTYKATLIEFQKMKKKKGDISH